MGYILDAVILVIAAIIVIRSYKLGLIRSIMSLIKGIASFIAAYAFTPTVKEFIMDRFMLSSISSSIKSTLLSLSSNSDGTYNLSKTFSEMPDALKQIVDRYGANGQQLTDMCKDVTTGNEEFVGKVSDLIATPVAEALSAIIAFVAIFIAAMLVLTIVTFLLDSVFKLPVLKAVNKTAGLVFGIIKALLFAFIIASIVSALSDTLRSVSPDIFGKIIDNSLVLKLCAKTSFFGLIDRVKNEIINIIPTKS